MLLQFHFTNTRRGKLRKLLIYLPHNQLVKSIYEEVRSEDSLGEFWGNANEEKPDGTVNKREEREREKSGGRKLKK